MINPTTNAPFTTADVDRILGLADQFLDDWEDDNRRPGTGDLVLDPDAVERRVEWDALRPLLLKLPALLALQKAVGTYLAAPADRFTDISTPLIACFQETMK